MRSHPDLLEYELANAVLGWSVIVTIAAVERTASGEYLWALTAGAAVALRGTGYFDDLRAVFARHLFGMGPS